jgi:uncharacterized membrane protein YidH (DUF202 family)
MNSSIKKVLLIIGVILLAYGIYTMVVPETRMSVGDLKVKKTQNNNSSYISIILGILAVTLSLIKEKHS